MLMLPILPPRMAQFHGLFTIVVVFGGIAAFHLVELRGIVPAKKYDLAFLLYPECLMVGAVPAMHFVADVAVNGSRIIIKPKNVGIVFKKRKLVREKRREARIHGVFKLAALHKIGGVVKCAVELAVFILLAYSACMVLVQVAHQYLGNLFGLNTVGLQVGNQLQFAVFGKTKAGIKQDYIAACNHAKGLHLHQYAAPGAPVDAVLGFIKRNKYFIVGYGKSAFAEGDDFHSSEERNKTGIVLQSKVSKNTKSKKLLRMVAPQEEAKKRNYLFFNIGKWLVYHSNALFAMG
jgi:hypothetical protein